jgi:DNA primase
MPTEVSLENIQEGAVLAADVLDARDNVLLSSGTQLTKAHISLIRRRGIESVIVSTPEDQTGDAAAAAVDPAQIAAALRQQEEVFAKTGGNPQMAAIHKAARAHLEAGNLPPG